jgi:hypothetical protein
MTNTGMRATATSLAMFATMISFAFNPAFAQCDPN